jgi:two-component system sensor histidine kinase VicK
MVLDNDHAPGGRSGRDIGPGGNRATLSVPLLAGGKCHALLQLGSVHRGFFTPGRVEFLASVAQRMSATLETARLRAELERHLSRALEAEARQRVIVNSAGEGIAETAPDGRFLFVNPALCRMFGYTSAELMGSNAHVLLHHSFPDGSPMPLELCTVERALATQPPGTPVEDVFWRKDGTPVPVRLLFTEAESATGERGTIAVVHDLTPEREQERQRDAFVAAASHELRTPLTSVLGFAELLKVRPVEEAQWRSWATSIFEDASLMSAIVTDMLDVARLQKGELRLRVEPTDLLTAAREMVEALPAPARARVTVEGEAGLLAQVDRHKLRQVLTNLVENALKYSPDGGQVSVRLLDAVEGEAWVCVEDQGMGISPQDLRTLFSPFQRIQRQETVGIRGTGLGLYLVKTYVEQMGGRIWAESELDLGSRFFVALPVPPRP